MIISSIEGQAFASFTLAYKTKSCKVPTPQVMMTDDWVKSVNLDTFECAKWMMVAGKKLRKKDSGEYETVILRPPYRVMALMLNRIFDRENGKWYKLSWIPLIYHVALEGTIFNWHIL